MRMHDPAHPGKLIAEFMGERTVTEVAKHLKITRATLSRILNGKSGVSALMALRLGDAFGLDAEVWLRLQAQRDIWVASRKKRAKVASLLVEHKKAA